MLDTDENKSIRRKQPRGREAGWVPRRSRQDRARRADTKGSRYEGVRLRILIQRTIRRGQVADFDTTIRRGQVADFDISFGNREQRYEGVRLRILIFRSAIGRLLKGSAFRAIRGRFSRGDPGKVSLRGFALIRQGSEKGQVADFDIPFGNRSVLGQVH
jgi:hypothetical protein